MELDTGNTAWILTSAALVLFMTPGLAFFYGGMTGVKSVLNMLMMSVGALGLVSVLWALYGYSVAFGTSQGGVIGDPFEYIGMKGLVGSVTDGLPDLLFASFQAMFAILTVALISGAIAGRVKFGAWMLFAGLWATLVYFPVAHWVFAFQDGNGGWIGDRLGALDFAGGTAVHINSGAAALALALVVGKRRGFPNVATRPHSVPLVLLGAGILWFGWFGFNAGSAVAADEVASLAFFNTLVATGAALLAWLGVEKLRDGHATTLGGASGIVAGLVAITPACAAVNPMGAIIIGLVAGGACAFAVSFKYRLGYDDSLDVVGIHLVGGLIGTLLIGLVAASEVTGGDAGILWGGPNGVSLLGKQALGAVAVLAYSFVVSFILGKIVDAVVGWRVSEEDEVDGVDSAVHAESAYDLAPLGGSSGAFSSASSIQKKVQA